MSKQDSESDINVDETQHQENSYTCSHMSKQDSEFDINVHDIQDEQNSHTAETLQIHDKYNTTIHDNDDLIHDENNTSENENIIEIKTYELYGEKIHETEESIPRETSQVLLYSTKQYIMKMIHQMTNL